MNIQDIAQWFIDNPQAWFQLAGLVVEHKPDYARQIAQAFDDQFWNWNHYERDCLSQYVSDEEE